MGKKGRIGMNFLANAFNCIYAEPKFYRTFQYASGGGWGKGVLSCWKKRELLWNV